MWYLSRIGVSPTMQPQWLNDRQLPSLMAYSSSTLSVIENCLNVSLTEQPKRPAPTCLVTPSYLRTEFTPICLVSRASGRTCILTRQELGIFLSPLPSVSPSFGSHLIMQAYTTDLPALILAYWGGSTSADHWQRPSLPHVMMRLCAPNLLPRIAPDERHRKSSSINAQTLPKIVHAVRALAPRPSPAPPSMVLVPPPLPPLLLFLLVAGPPNSLRVLVLLATAKFDQERYRTNPF